MPRRNVLRAAFLVAALAAAEAPCQSASPSPQESAVSSEPVSAERLAELYQSRSVTVAPPDDDAGTPLRLPYRLLAPARPLPGRRYPLVLFLHGAGERGDDNRAQLAYLPAWLAEPAARESFPCYVLAPQCRAGKKWVEVDWSAPESTPQRPAPSPDLLGAIAALEETLAREAVDPDRIYLTGLSMGGYGAWDMAARLPDRFAALLPVCGGGDEATAAKIVGLPVWCFHGDADTAVPVGRSRAMIQALRAAGGDPRYSELAGVGHDAWTPAYRDRAVLEWLFEQRR